MSQVNSFFRKRIDGVLLLLLFFIFSLAILFYYLQNVNTNMINNEEYVIGVVKLKSYNQEMDNTLMRSYRYLDNDKITEITKSFDTELLLLQKNKMHEVFSIEVSTLLHQIALQYNLKIDLVENFKTLNARITSTVYYLYELQNAIETRATEHTQVEKLLGDILFKIGQIFIGKEVEVLYIYQDLSSLKLHISGDEELDYFYRHSKQLVMDVELLNKLLKENEALALDKTIESLNVLLSHESKRNKRTEEMIGLAFFIFALIILIVLVYTYLKVIKNRAEVFYLAYHDTLTKLPNRAEFERYIGDLIERKNKRIKKFFILFVDLDRFKVINDTLGHNIGDEMLIVLAGRISQILGEKNLLARIGGDEFVAIIEDESKMEEIDILVAEIASTIREPIHIREYSLNTSASIGIAKYPDDGKSKGMLLKHADSAMYHAKENGGDTYAFYNEQLSINIERRLELEQELVYALKKEEFTLDYQPQYDLHSHKITGVEALVRWHSTTLGEVSPEEFISVAEDTGLIVELGYFVFRTACQEYMLWKSKGVDVNLMAINVSSVQLRQADAFKKFKRIIKETGMEARNIEIELTERYIMEYTTEKLTILDDLRGLGCRISIDDFGTGYSSMSYLRNISIDTIKIDKSFITDIASNAHDAKVAKAIIILTQSLGYEVIAEGVETLAQEDILRSYDCNMAQGYYFGKPMDSKTFIGFFKKHLSL